uniref:F-box domain-containing protein n=1 Tax=Globisporangium ultimum (strain ATCC 200006 / CBS 805.95 / DAOM BR144) TaxID=431595 RepID=K3WWB4_GLOUD
MHESQFHDLPAVLVVNVLSYLDGSDIVCAASMHRNWYIIAMCDSFWKSIYALRWQKVDAKQQGRNFANEFTSKYLNSKTAFPLQVSQAAMDGTLEISTESVEWMTLYRERHIVERNWVNGKATITTLNGHNGTITCLQFNDSRLVSGSDDGSMMLWSLLPRQEVRMQPPHQH